MSREVQRANRRKKYQEQRLDSKNAFGISDPTAKKAIDSIIEKERESK